MHLNLGHRMCLKALAQNNARVGEMRGYNLLKAFAPRLQRSTSANLSGEAHRHALGATFVIVTVCVRRRGVEIKRVRPVLERHHAMPAARELGTQSHHERRLARVLAPTMPSIGGSGLLTVPLRSTRSSRAAYSHSRTDASGSPKSCTRATGNPLHAHQIVEIQSRANPRRRACVQSPGKQRSEYHAHSGSTPRRDPSLSGITTSGDLNHRRIRRHRGIVSAIANAAHLAEQRGRHKRHIPRTSNTVRLRVRECRVQPTERAGSPVRTSASTRTPGNHVVRVGHVRHQQQVVGDFAQRTRHAIDDATPRHALETLGKSAEPRRRAAREDHAGATHGVHTCGVPRDRASHPTPFPPPARSPPQSCSAHSEWPPPQCARAPP